MTDPFDAPGSKGAGKFPAMKQLKGRLLLIEPTRLDKQITSNLNPDKKVDRMSANVTVLDGDPITNVLDKDGDVVHEFDEPLAAPHTMEDMYISQTVLVNQLRKAYKAESKVLGRLVQLPAARPGENKAWAFEEPTDADKDIARGYLASEKAKGKDDPWG